MRNEDVSLKGILVFLGILAATLTITYFSLMAMQRHLERKAEQRDELAERLGASKSVQSVRPYFPYPREQVNGQIDLQAFRAQEDAELQSYGWVNRTSGIVHIPIDRAMDLVVQRQEARQ
jgi:hypothetical protein